MERADLLGMSRPETGRPCCICWFTPSRVMTGTCLAAIRTVLREAEPKPAEPARDITRIWIEHPAELLRRDDWRLPR